MTISARCSRTSAWIALLARGFEAAEDAVAAGNVSTAAFIVGGVGLAAAGVLWFTASPDEPGASQTALGFGPGAFKLRTTW